MNIIHVIPISKSPFNTDPLSYFSIKDISIGSIVEVEVGKTQKSAIVIESEPVGGAKSRIRGSAFAMKKIGRSEPIPLYSPQFVQAIKKTSNYFATSLNLTFDAFTPKAIINENQLPTIQISKSKKAFEHLLLQAPKTDRIDSYKKLTRETLARKKSIFILTPSSKEAESISTKLKKGVEKRVFCIHSELTPKQQVSAWCTILTSDKSVVIIATQKFLSIPRHDIEAIIIEREGALNYKNMRSPYLDTRVCAKELAHSLGIKIIFADTFLRTKHHADEKAGIAEALEPLKNRIHSSAKVIPTDTHTNKTEAQKKKRDKREMDNPITPELHLLLKTIKKEKKKMFIFAARRGLSPTTVCGDCGSLVKCITCDSNMTLHKTKDGNSFACHRCGAVRDAHTRCSQCDGWKLVNLGYGIETIEKYIKKEFPKIQILKIDTDSKLTKKQLNDITKKFSDKSFTGILLGTEMAIQHITSTVDYSAAIGIDSILTIPDFSIEEKLFGLLATIRDKTKEEMLIQTRDPESALMQNLTTGDLSRFAKEENKLRKQLQYPPFYTLIKITISGTRGDVITQMQKLIDDTLEYSPRAFQTLTKKTGGFSLTTLLKIKKEQWPDEKLVSLLRSLPQHFDTCIEPSSTL